MNVEKSLSLLRPVMGAFLLWSVAQSFCYASTLYPFDNPKQTAQFKHLLYDLRCPVCQNQDLADSNAGLAKDLRNEVYQLVSAGKTDDEIIRYLTARYGDFILFKPPVKAVTLLLWFGPLLFIMGGLLVFYLTCVRRKSS